jgi:hypothetical protein
LKEEAKVPEGVLEIVIGTVVEVLVPAFVLEVPAENCTVGPTASARSSPNVKSAAMTAIGSSIRNGH